MSRLPSSKWPVLTVRIPPELEMALADYAFAKRMSKSDVVRLLLSRELGADPLEMEAMVQANARANAYTRVRQVLEEALIRFRDEAP